MSSLLPVAPQNPVLNWIATHAHNMDYLDSLYGVDGPNSYTPILSSTGSTQPNLGSPNQVVIGEWYRIFDVVFAWTLIVFDGGGGGGAGNWQLSLPVPAASEYYYESFPGEAYTVGSAVARDNSPSITSHTASVHLRLPDRVTFARERNVTGTLWDADTPFTWGDNDRFGMCVKYKGVFV